MVESQCSQNAPPGKSGQEVPCSPGIIDPVGKNVQRFWRNFGTKENESGSLPSREVRFLSDQGPFPATECEGVELRRGDNPEDADAPLIEGDSEDEDEMILSDDPEVAEGN